MDMFIALSDPTRRTILEMLAKNGRLSATEIYDNFEVSHPAISQHLKVLRDADLVNVEKRSQQRLYQINPKKIEDLDIWVRKLAKGWDERFDRLDKALENEKIKMKEKEVKK